MRRAIEFWCQALNYAPRKGDTAEGFTVLEPVNGTGPSVALMPSTVPAQEHPRVHLDLYTDNAAEQTAEVDRLVALGAQRVDWDLYPEDPDFVVLADPEGNRFCIIDTSHA
jgi:hypothetical protein